MYVVTPKDMNIKALDLKAEVQKKLNAKIASIKDDRTYLEKMHEIAVTGKLGVWWRSIPDKKD